MTNGGVLESLAPFRLPVLTHVHELDYWIERSGPENLRQVTAHTNAYVAAAKAVKENLVSRHGISGEKVRVIYEHIRELPAVPASADKAAARESLGIPLGAVVVGSCGSEYWRKGRDLVPQFLSILRSLVPECDVHFVWIGRPGDAEEERCLRHDLRLAGVEGFFRSTGEVVDPFRFFPSLDVFALLSRDDPYPLACLEVAATEVPVVCFAGAGGMPEFVRDGCGAVAPYLDLRAMAREVIGLIRDPDVARTCGRRARSKVARESLLEVTGPQLVAAITELLARR
jgi:glycosyltransferase involved in cell wall biosynthesis